MTTFYTFFNLPLTGRFPYRPEEVPVAAVAAIASQIGVPAEAWRSYDWRSRAAIYHRAQIRDALGFRESTQDDTDALARWLEGQVSALEHRPDRLVMDKLTCIRALAMPADLFADLPSKVLLTYRRRVAAEELHELRRHPAPIRLTLLAAFCHVRGHEITDALVDLLIATVHRIGATAEKRVESELIADLKRVAGKPALLFKLAAASLARPDDTVRMVVFPVVDEQTLRNLVAEGGSAASGVASGDRLAARCGGAGRRGSQRTSIEGADFALMGVSAFVC